MNNKRRTLALIIIDGWGYSPKKEGNAIALAHTPYYDEICRKYPKTLLAAAGLRVGLTPDTPGNSEVGHLNIGAGRIVQTDVSRISNAIKSGKFFENKVLKEAFDHAKTKNSAVHLIGLMSDGNVHSSPDTLFSLLRMAKKEGVKDVFVHPILDGRDVAPRTADIYVEALEIKLADIGIGRVATLCGRYYAMDKDKNWERTARAYTMLVHSEGERGVDAVAAIRSSFLRGISDEFIQPVVLEEKPGEQIASIKNDDVVIFFNHRADRMRQLVKALAVSDTTEFTTFGKPKIHAVCLTEYDRTFDLPVAFRQENEENVLAKVFAENGILNCRVMETEKYAHLTYFFNGGVELEHPCEHRVLIPSPKAAMAETAPEMACFKVTDKFLRGLEAGESDVFIINLAAPDTVAHTGNLEKTIEAVQFVDTCLGGIVEKIRAVGGIALITSDHGNCEEMADLLTGEPNNGHTANPVPFHFVDERANGLKLRDGGALEDIAPTLLAILGIEKPAEMTGMISEIFRKFQIPDSRFQIEEFIFGLEFKFGIWNLEFGIWKILKNILIIHFGQLGDVILSLPTFLAIREKFAGAKITVLVGKACAEMIELAGFADDKIAVDRVKLRDSGKLWSIGEIYKLARKIRRRKFDFIIDLHSLAETNLLGFFSGAKRRLYINRENRSLDFLGNFSPKPPLEDKSKHAADRYLDVLQSLSIENPRRFVQISPPPSAHETIENQWREKKLDGKKLVGLFPGAGHPSRRWQLENFAELAKQIEQIENLQTMVFLGPEETEMRGEVEERFPAATLIVEKLTLSQLAAAMTRLAVLISNDTGAMHVGALVGTPIVLLLDERAPSSYLPLTEKLHVINSGTLAEISVGEVFRATLESL